MTDNYIKDLNEEERKVLLNLICKHIRADGEIDQMELAFLNQIAANFGFDRQQVIDTIKFSNQIDYVAEAAKITNREHALEIIKELCVLANIDDDLHDDELDIIINAAQAMGIENEKILVINRWVLDSMILNKAGQVILEKNNG